MELKRFLLSITLLSTTFMLLVFNLYHDESDEYDFNELLLTESTRGLRKESKIKSSKGLKLRLILSLPKVSRKSFQEALFDNIQGLSKFEEKARFLSLNESISELKYDFLPDFRPFDDLSLVHLFQIARKYGLHFIRDAGSDGVLIDVISQYVLTLELFHFIDSETSGDSEDQCFIFIGDFETKTEVSIRNGFKKCFSRVVDIVDIKEIFVISFMKPFLYESKAFIEDYFKKVSSHSACTKYSCYRFGLMNGVFANKDLHEQVRLRPLQQRWVFSHHSMKIKQLAYRNWERRDVRLKILVSGWNDFVSCAEEENRSVFTFGVIVEETVLVHQSNRLGIEFSDNDFIELDMNLPLLDY